MINVYSFDKKLRKRILATREYFRGENVKKRSAGLYLLYKAVVGFSTISEGLYRISPTLEHKLLGGVMTRMFNLQETIHRKQYTHRATPT